MKAVLFALLAVMVAMPAFAGQANDEIVLSIDVLKAPADEKIATIYPPQFIGQLNMNYKVREGCVAQARVKDFYSITHPDSDLTASATVVLKSNCLEAAFRVREIYDMQTWSDGSKMYRVNLPPVPVIGGVTGSN